MSPLVTLWVASIIGAALFFAAGYLFRRPAAEVRVTDDLVPREPSVSEAERSLTRLTGERDALEARVGELEGQVSAHIAAREQVEERVRELERELAARDQAAQAQAADDDRPRERASTGEGLLDELTAESKAAGRDADVIASLLQILERHVESQSSWRAVTLADDLSMPIVGAGEEKEPLAVFSGLVDLIEMRTRALLPIKSVRRFTVEDSSGMVISTCTLPDRSLSLAMLTVKKTPNTESMSALLEHVARVL